MNIDNLKIWSLTDGSQGMISQARGLAYQFNKNIVELKTDVIFPWSRLQPGIFPVFKWIFRNNIPLNSFPNILISCGRKSVYLSMYLKKRNPKIINIHIQNPKITSKNFSFVVAPNHDNYKGSNIINSVGALHHFKIKTFDKSKARVNKNNLVSCIVGGENNHYLFSIKEAKNFCNKIINLRETNSNLKFLIITSRRTSEKIKTILYEKMSSFAQIWLGEGKNPYEYALYNSKHFIITSDSTSMISEASISGKPIYIYKLPYKRKSIRLDRFHEEFRKLNITRDIINTNILENWSYEKLNESERIAGIIKERIIQGNYESR